MEKMVSEQEIDRISSLPNSIQSLILSFLPVQDGIRTRILSKDWKYVCACFSEMNFNKREYQLNTHNTKLFKDHVNHTLGFHDGSALYKFILDIRDDEELSAPLILEWISFALYHNVQHLVVRVTPGKLENLPPRLFTCGTLTMLELFHVDLSLPTSSYFPVLKHLTLCCIVFHGENQVDQLIPSCPVLEKLRIASCFWDNRVVVNITTPTLKILRLGVPNPDHGDIKISAPNLRQISYTGNPPDISRESLMSVDKASFYFSFPSSTNSSVLDTFRHHTNTIFRGQHNFKDLTLGGFVFEHLSRIQDLFSRPLTACTTVKSLKLQMCCSGDNVYAMLFLFKDCPNLQDLTTYFEGKSRSSDMFNMERYSESQELATRCNLNHLKTVTFNSFVGTQGELDLAKYLLDNAEVMKEMKIIYSKKMKKDSASQKNIYQKFLMMTKASPDAVISFS